MRGSKNDYKIYRVRAGVLKMTKEEVIATGFRLLEHQDALAD